MAIQQNTTDQATTIARYCAQAHELLERLATDHYSQRTSDTPQHLYSVDKLLCEIEDAIGSTVTDKVGV